MDGEGQEEGCKGGHDSQLAPQRQEVAEKLIRHSETLGGVSRITFQMNAASLSHENVMGAIELIGTSVAPAVRSRRLIGSGYLPTDGTELVGFRHVRRVTRDSWAADLYEAAE